MPFETTWPPSLVAQLRALWPQRDLTAPEIARRLGRSEQAVRKKARAIGLPRRRDGEEQTVNPNRWHPDRIGAGAEPLPAKHPISWDALMAAQGSDVIGGRTE